MMDELVRWFRNRAIRLQLIASMAGVSILLMTLLVAGLVERQQSFLTDRARDRCLRQADLLAAGSLPQLLTGDLAALASILTNLAKDRTVRYAMVTDLKGHVLAHTETGRVGKYLQDPASLAVLQGPPVPHTVSEQGRIIQSASPVLAGDQPLGWAWVAGDLSSDWEHIAWVARAGLAYTFAAIGLGTLLAAILARTIMRPLRLLLKGAQRLRDDNLDVPIPLLGHNEIGVVARAFNGAMRRLREQREQLRKARDELETRVEQRTAELKRAREELERRVAERTAALAEANRALRVEIGERKEIEQALRRKNEDLKDFAYAVSHDLQQPLRSMSGYAELLERRYAGALDADATDFVRYIAQGSRRMQRLIRDLLEYSRAASSEGIPPHPVDSEACFSDACQNLEQAIESSQAVIECDPLPSVMAHEVAVLQLIQNLLANAIKYRGADAPRIRAGAAARADEVEFFVSDNGIGIDPAYHGVIFRLFRRLHDDETGTGIGLAMCARIVQRYGGRIWVESAPDQGSTFRFTLPPVKEGAAALPS